jgi:hypothetical protein
VRCDRAAAILAAATTLFHLLTAGGYGIFRDELYENNRTLWVLRGPRRALTELWPRVKHFE